MNYENNFYRLIDTTRAELKAYHPNLPVVMGIMPTAGGWVGGVHVG